jgi:hypothetical protein
MSLQIILAGEHKEVNPKYVTNNDKCSHVTGKISIADEQVTAATVPFLRICFSESGVKAPATL